MSRKLLKLGMPAALPVRLMKPPVERHTAILLMVPYILVFFLFVAYPIAYGVYLASNPSSYVHLFQDPSYFTAVVNTAAILLIAVNIKLALALWISGLFIYRYVWIRWLALFFMLPWAIPSLVSILSIRWMLNAEWGMINNIWFWLTGQNGQQWLLSRTSALACVIVVHIWRALPFWTLMLLAGRLAIPQELYEAAALDGVTTWQGFRYVTFPALRGLYLTCTVLSTVWTLGDFNTVYLLTDGGPGVATQVLATLGFRYAFQMNDLQTATATVATALPLLVPLLIILVIRLRRERVVFQ